MEDFEAGLRNPDPKEFLKARRKARTGRGAEKSTKARTKQSKGAIIGKTKANDMPQNALMAYTNVIKPTSRGDSIFSSHCGKSGREVDRAPLSAINDASDARVYKQNINVGLTTAAKPTNLSNVLDSMARTFRLPSTQIMPHHKAIHSRSNDLNPRAVHQVPPPLSARSRSPPANPFAAFSNQNITDPQRTPHRPNKRQHVASPSPARSQKTIDSYWSPSPRRFKPLSPPTAAVPLSRLELSQNDVIDLVSSSPPPKDLAFNIQATTSRPQTPTPSQALKSRADACNFPPDANPHLSPLSAPGLACQEGFSAANLSFSPGKLPSTVTKRRKKTPPSRRRAPLQRFATAPVVIGDDSSDDGLEVGIHPVFPARPLSLQENDTIEAIDLASPAKSEASLPSPSTFLNPRLESNSDETRAIRRTEEVDEVVTADSAYPDSTSLPALLDTDFILESGKLIKSSVPTSLSKCGPSVAGQQNATTLRRSPRPLLQNQQQNQAPLAALATIKRKTRIQLRPSLEGSWKEVEAEAVDLSGDGSGWAKSRGKAEILGSLRERGWRKSGVEILDLTGA